MFARVLCEEMYRASRLLCHYASLGATRSISNYCLLFPGQGSQFVGMAKKFITAGSNFPAVHELFEVAHGVLGRDMKELFLCGPQSLLDETVHCQPAVVLASLVAMESLKQTHPQVLSQCCAGAGFSVGEVTTLIASGSINLEQGLHFVNVRALAMQEACIAAAPSSMLTIIGLTKEDLEEIITSTRTPLYSEEATIANHIFPRGYVVSGKRDRVERIGREAIKRDAVLKEVKVSGAFHSKLMASAVMKLEGALEEMQISEPSFPVYSNVTGLPYCSVSEIRRGLTLQVTSPVLWDDTIRHILHVNRDRVMKFIEVGPGKQLKGMLKRIDKAAFRNCNTVTV